MSHSNVALSHPYMDQGTFRVSIRHENGATSGFDGNGNTIVDDTNTFLFAAMNDTLIRIGTGQILTKEHTESIAEELIVAQVDEMMDCL